MSHLIHITGRVIAAARALTGISRADPANAAGISLAALARMEAGGGAPLQSAEDVEAISRALEDFGAIFISEGDGLGAGVRLKFSRQDVRQIGQLETEGGIVRDDDVP